MLTDADELLKRANALIAGADRILRERPASSGKLRLDVTVNGVNQ